MTSTTVTTSKPMIRFQIPENYETALIKIKELPEESLQQLTEALKKLAPQFLHKDLVSSVASRVDKIPEADLNEILETVVSLYGAQDRLEVSWADLVGYVCTAMEESDNEELRLTGKECDDFRTRLIGLLDIESLVYPAKTAAIVFDHDRIFLHGRVITDIRGIFGPETEDIPKGAAIVHVLNITYQHNRRPENFYVAMDSESIGRLIAKLQRAQSKEKGLKKLLEKAEVCHVTLE